MPDPFDAIQQTVSAQQDAAAAPRDAFTEINGQGDPLRATAYLGAKMAPERAAKVIALRDRTGLPADLVDRNLEDVEQQAKSADFDPDQFRKTSPKVAEWLAQQPEHYAISADDLPRLAALERFVSQSQDYAWHQGGSISGPYDKNGYREFYRTTADLLRSMQRQQADEAKQIERAKFYGEQVAKDFGVFAPIATGAIGAIDATARLVGIGDERMRTSAALVSQGSAIRDPGFWNDVQRGVGGLAADAPLMIAGAALAPLAAVKRLQQGGKLARYAQGALSTAVASQPLAIREGVLTGHDEGWANGLASWGIETAIPAAFGTTGAERIITTLAARGVTKEAAPSLARVAGRLLLDAGLEGTEEGVTELAHAIHEVARGINPSALDPEQLWPRLATASTVGAIAGGGFNLPQAIVGLSRRGNLDRDANRLIQAASGQQVLEGVIQAAQESITAGRSPEAARTLFQSLVADKVPQVYVDREAWDAHFRSLNQDPRAKAAELMGDAKAYDEAARTGAPLTLQTGKLAVDVSKDAKTAEWITREARLDPAMMNAREAADAVAALETVPDDPEAKLQQTAQEAAQAVQDDVEQQLTAAGYDAGSARRSATQMAAVFRTMAVRFNEGKAADDPTRISAAQLWREWGVSINRPVADILARPTFQTADQTIATMRARLTAQRQAEGDAQDAARVAAQRAADQQLAQDAAGEVGDRLIADAITALEKARTPGGLTIGDAMRALGPDFGFKPDATAVKLTPEQTRRGNLLAAALRARGGSLAALIEDAGATPARPDPVATTARQAKPVQDDPRLEKLAADGLRLRDLVAYIQAGRADIAELEQAAALAAEVGPELDRLPLDQQRIEDIRAAVEFAQEGQTMNQGRELAAGRRGSINFGGKPAERRTLIRLFESADLSTFLHESGHLYLEVLADLAARPGAPQQIKDDLAKALAHIGATSYDAITTEQHETWARSWEAYLLEGKAPSAELRDVFARFAAWMAAIYKSVKNLSVNLTPEVRGVFDRLLATQEEIADASAKLGDDPLFADAKAAGMSDADFATYQKAREDARRQAEDDLRTQAMAEITRERTAAWKELRVEVGQEVESETNRAKEYVAESILRRGELPGGVPLPSNIPAIKLDSVDLRRRIDARLGTEAERKAGMKRMAMMHTREVGIPVDQAATLLGFDSGDALLRALLTLRPRRELIEAETDQRMRARFGDMLTDGSIAEKAMAALHNERRADVHLAEVKALATRVGKKVAPIEVLREAARRKIDATPAKDLLPQLYARAEAKARRALEKALAKQDFPAAWNAKQTELLNHELYRASIDAKREADEIQAYAKKFNEIKARERIGKAGGWEWTVTRPDGRTETAASEEEARVAAAKVKGSRFDRTSGYLEQIDGLLERYEFRRVTNRAIERRQSLREWAAIQQASGAAVNIPPEVLNDAQRRNWRQAPLAELRGVRDTLAHIAHLAKTKNQLTKAQRERELDQLAGTLRDTLVRTHPKQNVPDAGSKAGVLPSFIAAHRKSANIARVMDGDDDAGPFWDALIRPMNEAADAEAVRLREAKDKQEAIWKRWEQETKGDGWKASERREFAGFKGGLDRLGAIMVALNWGNEGNRERLLEGGQGLGKLTEPQVQAVLDSLNAADWNLVEDIWNHIDSYWSDIKALEQRTTGVAPAKVDPSPFPTKHGTIKGGYFPISYDGQETGRIDGDATDLGKQIQAQAFGRTATAHGHTKERTIGQGRRLNLDPGVIGQHLTKVVHDLTHREALADTMRILLHPEVRSAIDSRMGSATTKALRQWIADIATGGQMPDAVARGISLARRGFSISTMGFKATTAALQLTGFSNSAVRVGPARMAKAIATLYSQKDGTTAWAFVPGKSTMMAERERTQTREINEILGQFQRGKFATFQQTVGKYAFWMLQKVQSFVDRATWLAAYEKALDEGHADALAVSIADQTVLDTQSGGQTKDLAGVQRSPYAQILTGAYTYGSLVFNQVYDQGARISRNPKDFATWAGALGNMMLATALPTIGSVLLRALTRDDWPEEKNDKDSIAKRIGVEFASTILGSMVLAREVGGFFSGFDYSGPGVTKPFADLTKLGNQAMQGDLDVGLLRAVINATGSTLGLPSSQLWAMGSGAVEWLENPSPDVRPIVFGPSPNR